MKVHIGTDKRGIVHTLTTTHAAEADINQLPNLVHGEERELYGDRAYWNESDRRSFEEVGVRYRVNRRGSGRKPLTERWRRINRSRSRVRARDEHRFFSADAETGSCLPSIVREATDRGLNTSAQLARWSGLSEGVLWAWVRGKRSPRRASLDQLASGLEHRARVLLELAAEIRDTG